MLLTSRLTASMELPNDFNSSDIKFSDPPLDRWANVGAKSVEAIINHAAEDRIASKKMWKELKFVRGRPGTQYRHDLWFRRIETFREHVLHVKYVTLDYSSQNILMAASILEQVRDPL